MQFDEELRTVVPHANRATYGFTAWLDEHPYSFSCLAEAIHDWLDDEGASAEDTGYTYEAWLETVLYILIDWSINPERYEFRHPDGELATFAQIVASDMPGGKLNFLNRSFYLVQCTAAKLYRLNQLHRN